MSKLNRVLLFIVIILATATALVWFKPELFSSFSLSSLSSLNPFNKSKGTVVVSDTTTTQRAPVENLLSGEVLSNTPVEAAISTVA